MQTFAVSLMQSSKYFTHRSLLMFQCILLKSQTTFFVSFLGGFFPSA